MFQQMIKKGFVATFLTLIIVTLIVEWFNFQKIEQILYEFNTKGKDQSVHDSIKDYQAVPCSFDLFSPAYGLITFAHYQYPERGIDRESLSVGFYNLSRNTIFSTNWSAVRTGGTTVKNTTFEELLAMVKKDCSQFQETGSISLSLDEMRWVYSAAPTKEELEKERLKKIQEIKMEIATLNAEKKQELTDGYGYNPDFTDDELYEWAEQVDLTDFDPGF